MVHDLEENLILALEVVIETALTELERRRDIVHRRGIVTALLEQPRCGAQNFLPGINQSLASHRVSW